MKLTSMSLPQLAQASIAPPEEKKRGVSRNKNAGHGYERDCRDIFRNLGFIHVTTSRAESRNRDNQKIDLINKDEEKHGRLPYNIQCKCTTTLVNYHEIFNDTEKTVLIKKGPNKGNKVAKMIKGMDKVPGVINVILNKLTFKDLVIEERDGLPVEAEVFKTRGFYAIMRKQDFLIMVMEREELKKLREEYKMVKEEVDMLNDTNKVLLRKLKIALG